MSFRSSVITLAILTLTVTLALGIPVQAGDDVPFKGEVTASFVGFEPPNVGIFNLTGKSTHMGKVSGSARVYFTPMPKDADLTVIAANGDEIYMKTHGEPDASGAFVGSYTVTGGTGRFEDATGSGSWTSVAIDDDNVNSTWQGTISY